MFDNFKDDVLQYLDSRNVDIKSNISDIEPIQIFLNQRRKEDETKKYVEELKNKIEERKKHGEKK